MPLGDNTINGIVISFTTLAAIFLIPLVALCKPELYLLKVGDQRCGAFDWHACSVCFYFLCLIVAHD